MSNKDPSSTKGKMSKSDSERIQSSQAKGGKDTSTESFYARAQSAGDKNSGTGGQSGQDGGNAGAQGQKQGKGGSKK